MLPTSAAPLLLLFLSLLLLTPNLSLRHHTGSRVQAKGTSLVKKSMAIAAAAEDSADDDSCIKNGSCRQVRGDFKKELNAHRKKRTEEGSAPEANYMEVLSSSGGPLGGAAKRTFSPFKKTPPKQQQEAKKLGCNNDIMSCINKSVQ